MSPDTAPTSTRAAIYRRASTQAHDPGLTDQLAAARTLAAQRGYAIAAECAEAETGTVEDRAELARLLALVRAGQVDTIICAQVDRLARDAGQLAQVEAELARHGVTVVQVGAASDR